jgi:hypothetical protein
MMLTSISTLIIFLVILPLPGGRGPLQLWAADAFAMFVFDLRVATILILPISPIICGLVGKIRLELGEPFQLRWVIAAVTSYFLAWFVVCSQAFFPTA